MATIITVDREQLNDQRLSIVELLDTEILDERSQGCLQGVLNLLDEIQDHADYCKYNKVDIELR